ncbi:MAG: glycosyltransferase family 4 protein [Anaerolineae bacterium]|nr:glycosyltransferase family 4 protein [Anaerolineae bacterium]
MRIGIDYTAAAQEQAGIGRYTRELVHAVLAPELASRGHDYVAFAAAGGVDPAVFDPLRAANVQLRTLPISDEWVARLWHRLRLPLPVELLTGKLDIFYSPNFVLPPTLPQTRTLLTVHDLSFVHYPDHFVPRLVEYLSRVVPRSVRRADHILADSESTRRDLIHQLDVPPDRVTVIYCGVDKRFEPTTEAGKDRAILQRYDLLERPYVLAVGTLQPRKNHVRLIQAFAALDSDAELVIAGGRGWLYEGILKEADKHPDCVRVLGFVDDSHLPALYRGARVFTFPSLYEGFGIPVLEAMACGTPVVCSNASSLPEVAGDATLLVNPLDVSELTLALARALEDNDLRQAMIRKGIQQSRRFTWVSAARQLLSVFETCGVAAKRP